MKKIIVILLAIFSAAVAYGQNKISYYVNDPGLGKVRVSHPTVYIDGNDTVYNYCEWLLCMEENQYGKFDCWRVRYYGDTISNETVYDVCIHVDTTGMHYREIIYIAFFNRRTDIEDVVERAAVIFPNPATDIIYLNKEVEEYKLYNSDGKLILRCMYTDYIDISGLEPGMYILSTDLGNYKIIKL